MQLSKWSLIIIIAFAGIIFISCSSTQGTVSSHRGEKGTQVENRDTNLELVDMLRQVPGLDIRGSGYNVQVTIRGAKSIYGDNSPLYVYAGVPLGRDYNSVASSINIQEVASIRVLTGAQSGLYGVRGANGVIIINKKK